RWGDAGSRWSKEHSHLRESFRSALGASRSGHCPHGFGPEEIRPKSVSANPRRQKSFCHGRLWVSLESLPESHTHHHDSVCALLRLPDVGVQAECSLRKKNCRRKRSQNRATTSQGYSTRLCSALRSWLRPSSAPAQLARPGRTPGTLRRRPCSFANRRLSPWTEKRLRPPKFSPAPWFPWGTDSSCRDSIRSCLIR